MRDGEVECVARGRVGRRNVVRRDLLELVRGRLGWSGMLLDQIVLGEQRGTGLLLDDRGWLWLWRCWRRLLLERRGLDVEDACWVGGGSGGAVVEARSLETEQSVVCFRGWRRGRLRCSRCRRSRLPGRRRWAWRRACSRWWGCRRSLVLFSAVEQGKVCNSRGRRRLRRLTARRRRVRRRRVGTHGAIRRFTEVQKDEIAATRRSRIRLRLRLGGGIDRLHSCEHRLRLSVLAFSLVPRPQRLQLLNRLVLAVELRQLVGKHEANVVLSRTQISEFFQGAERLIKIP